MEANFVALLHFTWPTVCNRTAGFDSTTAHRLLKGAAMTAKLGPMHSHLTGHYTYIPPPQSA